VTGMVSDQAGQPLIGANVFVKGTTVGTVTDFNGHYSITVPDGYDMLIVSYTGYATQELSVGQSSEMNVSMVEGLELSEAVVTALGVTREKKSLGFATQEVKGEDLNIVKSDNFINALSGRTSGVQIRRTTNMGGSTNINIRGIHSLQGDNQALFVIDGVPVNNRNTNTRAQEQAGIGYDFGNAASDLNPDDIESVNVLKGAAASALYGSRAANGVIMITTKNGSKKGKGVGISLNSNVTVGSVDKSTFPTYQKKYGAGYGDFYDTPDRFILYDVNGDGTPDKVTPLTEDASYGSAFDASKLIYQWDAFVPASPNYLKATPWVAAPHDPSDFFETPLTFTNTVAFDKSYDAGDFRLAYTNYNQDGLLPNSSLKKNNFSAKTTLKVTDKLTVTGFANYLREDALGRNGTGYSNGVMSSMRQWWQVNVDIQELKDLYFKTRENATWNWSAPFSGEPIYWDNPYWVQYENYENDSRNRILGYITAEYQLFNWLSVFGRASLDTYDEFQEQRLAVGSVPNRFGIGTDRVDGSIGRLDAPSGYSRRDIISNENNFDAFLKIHKDLTDKINLTGLLGSSIRRARFNSVFAATNGGLVVPHLYALQNTVDALPLPIERDERVGINGLFANASIGYDNFLYLDGSIRRDESSTLPVDNRVYYYPSASISFVFSKFLENDWLSFGKIRANYAEVGASAGFNNLADAYIVNTAFNAGSSSLPNTKKNSELKPERTKSYEAGLEMRFFLDRLGFDFAYYKTNSINQILPIRTSSVTGYVFKVINAGEIENKGIELSLDVTPVRSTDFNWSVLFNFTRNRNKVISLTEGLTNIQLGSFQGGVTLNARIGEAYGVLFGKDYVYLHPEAPKPEERLVRQSGAAKGNYQRTVASDITIGDPNPDWIGGISNKLSYKNFSMSFLIDIQHGGDVFSLDKWYADGTGIYEESAGNNELGNPIRDPVTNDATSGGVLYQGANPDGSPNTYRVDGSNTYTEGYAAQPQIKYVYDAGYVKLREVALSYTFPSKMFEHSMFSGLQLSLVGSNLWIIHKSLPYADPEAGLGSGNLQGYSIATLPSTRDISFNLNVKF
ncbi:MAG TPA: SusC/RagA family TonB-linked outer membrane protein, partial [Saprospiraceae bacterium]|nr:SusC/RagA family TonB-linked outer membrane protein [Saprospiraceae bacterium]